VVMFVSPFLDLPEEDIRLWVDQTINIVLTLIAGYSATDFAKAMGQPAGVGHKELPAPAPDLKEKENG